MQARKDDDHDDDVEDGGGGDGWLVGWLGFNGTFSTNRPYCAIGKVKVC